MASVSMGASPRHDDGGSAPKPPPRSGLSAAGLFEQTFLPFYPPDARADLGRARAADANPGKNPSILAQLDEAAAIFARLAPAALGAPDLALDFTDASV